MSIRRYWEILEVPRPNLKEVFERNKKTLPFHLMCVALVENGHPMTIPELAVRFQEARLPLSGNDPELTLKRAWHGREPIHKLPNGNLALDINSHELEFILLMADVRLPRRRATTTTGSETVSEWAHERRVGTPVAILHALPQDAPPIVVSILDPDKHSITTMTDDALSEAGAHLKSYERIAGLTNWETLHYLALDHNRWLLIDIVPYQKSFQLTEGGPSVKLTPEMIITGTTGIRRPLHTAKAVARLAQKRDRKDLIKCVEDGIKALYALYRFGCLHSEVIARVGRHEYGFPVHWSMNSQPPLDDLLAQAVRTGARLEVLTGDAPDWNDPWDRSRAGCVLALNADSVLIQRAGTELRCDRHAIQAARIVQTRSI